MNIFKLSGLAGLSLVALSTFNACTDYTPFDEADIFHHEYSKNFFATYGNFPADMNWDFSDAPRTAPTDPSIFDLGRENAFVTRSTSSSAHKSEAETEVSLEDAKTASILYVPSGTAGAADDPYYYLEVETYDWLKANLPEGVNNTPKGSPFVFKYGNTVSETQKFAIIPFYQGFGTVVYKLHMVAVDQKKDYVIWDNWSDGTESGSYVAANCKGTDAFQCNTSEYQPSRTSSKWGNVNKITRLDNIDINKNIRSKPMIISNLTGEFYFYLEVTQNTSSYESPGAHMSSKEGMMYALPCPTPKHINDYKGLFGVDNSKTIDQVMVIGCEDTRKSDWDINDICFLIVGLIDLPQKIEAKHSKRYLIEDLGTTVDFDFNDVVVDVTETVATYTDGTTEILTQEAVIRHKCGTVPFQVYFCDSNGDVKFKGGNGNKPAEFDVMQGHVQGQAEQYTDFDDENVRVRLVYSHKETTLDATKYKVVGAPFWEPEKNNIRINVSTNGTLTGQNWKDDESVGQVMTGHFNKPGDTKAPYIIAVPTTQDWTAERENFPISTFTELPSSTTPDNE